MAGPNNSGISVDFQPDLAASAEAVAAAVPQALADCAMSQGEAAQFLHHGASGAAVLTEGPAGVGGDADL